MSGTIPINVSTGVQNECAKSIEAITKNSTEYIKEYINTERSLTQNWQGEANNKHMRMVNDSIPNYDKLLGLIQVESLKLSDIAVNYQGSEERNRKTADSLDTNFL